jgi:plastocyanin
MESSSVPIKNDNNKSKKQFLLLSGIALLLIIGVILMIVLGGGSKNNKASKSVMKNEPGSYQNLAQLRNYKHEAVIQISSNGPLPATLNVQKDTKVIWQNGDNKAHAIAIVSTEKVPSYFFNNRNIEANAGYAWVVHQPVTFHYYIVDSPTQTGVVVVK